MSWLIKPARHLDKRLGVNGCNRIYQRGIPGTIVTTEGFDSEEMEMDAGKKFIRTLYWIPDM